MAAVMASSTARAKLIQMMKFRPKIPERLKGGRLERIANYFKRIADDYKAACLETVEDMKASPHKTAVYLSILGSGVILAKTNPSETSFRVKLTECAQELMLIGEPIRNRHSDRHVQYLLAGYQDGTIRYTNCGFFSLIWIAGFDPTVSNFEARCKQVKPRWIEFHKHVVDVGVLGRWHLLHRTMQDYDINTDEWDKEGRKRQTSVKEAD